MRMPGISTLCVQTAGYSGHAVPEIRIEAIEHAEELGEWIRPLVRQSGIQDYGTRGVPSIPVSADQKIIIDLVKIRTSP